MREGGPTNQARKQWKAPGWTNYKQIIASFALIFHDGLPTKIAFPPKEHSVAPLPGKGLYPFRASQRLLLREPATSRCTV